MKPHLLLPRRGRKKDSDKKNGKRRRIDIHRTGLALFTVVVLSVLLCTHLIPDQISLTTGDIAPEDIRAFRSVRYVDTQEFRKQQNDAAAAVEKIYDSVPYTKTQAARDLSYIFDAIRRVRDDNTLSSTSEKVAYASEEIKSHLGIQIPEQSLQIAIRAPLPDLADMQSTAKILVQETMSGQIRNDESDLPRARTRIAMAAKDAMGDTKYASTAASLANTVIRPNRIYNAQETTMARERARTAVKPVYSYIRSGDLIIAKGQRVTSEHIEKFTALGLRQRRIDYPTIVSLSSLVAFLVGLVILYLARYQPSIYRTTRLLWLLSLVVIMSTLGLKLLGVMLGIELSGLQLAYLSIMLTTTAGMILAVLLNPQIAVLIVAMLAIASGLVMNHELRYAISTLVSGLVAIYSVANIRHLADVMRASGAIAVTNIAIVWITGGLFGDSVGDMASGSVWALVVAMSATWFFVFSVRLLERPFRITTHISLLELADTNRPILRRLVVEAPGTYTHSMAVGHLAEAAAEAIGADSLFARVASYYHDIGKIRRPHFFVENQRIENIHDRMNPTLSALVITSHIKDGLEVAREFKLPLSIQEIIIQHHGTSLVQYFYNQMTGQVEPSPVLEQQFRYDGPKPQSKEAAIIMLADSVEAASRSLAKPTTAALETLVDKIISAKLQDGQMDQSELTFRDIGIIKETFIRTLKGTLHARIDYQESMQGENGKASNGNGDTDKELTDNSGEPGQAQENSTETAAGSGVPGDV
jgi:putative nucleotidyltransferase with HDIG domain